MFTIDSILDDLKGLGLHFLPYQMYKINQLQMISSGRNLAVQDFKTFSFDEMQRAKDILGRLTTANETCLSNLEKTDKAVESFVRFEELLLEITTHIASGRQKLQQNISRGKDNLKQQQARLNNEQRAIDAFTTELEQLPDSQQSRSSFVPEKLLLSNIEHEVQDSTTEAPMNEQSRQLIEDEIKSTEKLRNSNLRWNHEGQNLSPRDFDRQTACRNWRTQSRPSATRFSQIPRSLIQLSSNTAEISTSFSKCCPNRLNL